MDKVSIVYFGLILIVVFHTGYSASTKSDERPCKPEYLIDETSSAKNLSDLDINAIMDDCNASFKIDIALLTLLNSTDVLKMMNSTKGKTELFLEYELSQIDDEILFAEYLKSLNDSGSFPDETEKTPKCFIRCYFNKIGVMTEEGVFDKDVATILFAGERGGKVMNDISEMIDKCLIGRNETCQCEKAYAFSRCVMEAEIDKYDSE